MKRERTLRKEALAALTADVARAEAVVSKTGERVCEAKARRDRAALDLAGAEATLKFRVEDHDEAKRARDEAVAALTESLEVTDDGRADCS